MFPLAMLFSRARLLKADNCQQTSMAMTAQPQSLPVGRNSHSSAWSIPLMCLGLGVIAACVLVPQAEGNRKLAAECDKLQRDLTYVQTQLSVNQEFLRSVGGNAGLAERLAQRQMKVIRQGTSVLQLR